VNDNKVTILGFLFFLFCVGLMGGIYVLNGQLETLQAEYDDLEQRRVNLEQDTQVLMDQKRVFTKAFDNLKNYKINVASEDMGFYAEVQQAVQKNEINILSTRQQGETKEGRSSISLTLKGDYYSFMRVLSDWRNLPITVRVANLTVTASKTPETRGEIQADVLVEAIVAKTPGRR
jgi:Tfp pilus assembly protein PilO